MSAMTGDCVFESPAALPDGTSFQGAAAVRSVWDEFFADSPNAVFETEELVAFGDRCLFRWIYSRNGEDDVPGHVRGVDIFVVRDGKVAAKYV